MSRRTVKNGLPAMHPGELLREDIVAVVGGRMTPPVALTILRLLKYVVEFAGAGGRI